MSALTSEDEVVMEGELRKRRSGGGKHVDNIFGGEWPARHFRLRKSGMLEYYEIYGGKNISPDVRNQINLKDSNCQILFWEPNQGQNNETMTVSIPGNDKWRMSAENRQTLTKWRNALDGLSISYKIHDTNRSVSPSSPGNSPDKHSTNRNSINSVSSINDNSTLSINNVNSNNQSSFNGSVTQNGPNSAPPSPSPKGDLPKPAVAAPKVEKKGGKRKMTSTHGESSNGLSKQFYEIVYTIVIVNLCIVMGFRAEKVVMKWIYYVVANFVLAATLHIRSQRSCELDKASSEALATAKRAEQSAVEALEKLNALMSAPHEFSLESKSKSALVGQSSSSVAEVSTEEASSAGGNTNAASDGKPVAGATFRQVEDIILPDGGREYRKQTTCDQHTWSRCDHRLFNVRVGPNYAKNGKKAPSAAPLFEAFAVDIFCSDRRIDHAASRFQMPAEYLDVNTGHPHFPPVLIVQMQLPSEKPDLNPFSPAVEDGPGWAILMYFRITEDTLNQLKDMKTASPAVKLFAKYAEKAKDDPAWRARFKVIASCLNIEALNIPSSAAGYNAKPVLIRRTGSVFKTEKYMELDLHVHKFDRVAKSLIHGITKDCGKAYMQIGFVVEGREEKEDNMELPETLFACVGVNRPQEGEGEYLFDN